MDKKYSRIHTLAFGAVFAALITVTTAFVKIPTPMGYIHAGDALVFLTAIIVPPPFCFIASAIGGALADLLAGYAVWAIPTAVIKALNVLPFVIAKIILNRNNKPYAIFSVPMILAVIISCAVTVAGYFFANCLLYDYAAAWAEVPFNLVQSAVGAVLFAVAALALKALRYERWHL